MFKAMSGGPQIDVGNHPWLCLCKALKKMRSHIIFSSDSGVDAYNTLLGLPDYQ